MMSARDGRKIVDEIVDVRNRLRFQMREAELFVRLRAIKDAYKKFDHGLTELLRYFPISLVACIESYFRLAMKELIDSGEPYLSNSRHLLSGERYDFEILKGLHGQTVSIGEVISHHPSINNLGQVISLMNTLMDGEFRSKICNVHDRWAVEVKKQPKQPIIKDENETFRYVEKTFELRHVFCHEIATAIEVEEEDIEKCVDHTTVFLKASDAVFSQTLHPNAPLTQTDINLASYEDYQREKALLDALLGKVTEVLSGKQKEKFRDANKAWESFVKASIEIEGLEYEGGSIRPNIEHGAATRFVRERKRQIEKLLNSLTEP